MVLAGAFGVHAPAQSGLPMVQPDAGFVLGVEWRRIVDSPAGAMLTDQIKKSGTPAQQGLEEAFIRGLDSVVIASPASALAKSGTQPPVLVILKGRFASAQIRGLLGAEARSVEKYHSVELLSPPDGAADTRIALLDAGTILAGDRAQICAAIDRIKTGHLNPARGGIMEGVADLAAKNDLWMVVQVPANATKDAPAPMAQMFSGVRSAELGVSLQQGLALRLNVLAKDEGSAKTMADAVQGLMAMAAMSQGQASQPSLDFLRKMRIAPEGSRVKLELALDQGEFEKILKDARNASMAALAPTKPAAIGTIAPPPAERAAPKTIRISGLDGGPVEVPLTGTQK
jgi:hypothetical protein